MTVWRWSMRAMLAGCALWPWRVAAQWNGHASDPQHTALSSVPTQPLNGIRWTTPVDESAASEPILIHYGSPVITQSNTVVVPVREADGGYRLEARRGSDGSLLWNAPTDFVNAPSDGNWVPSFSPTLVPSGALYFQGVGGTVYRVANPNGAPGPPEQMSFLADYKSHKAAYDSTVFISTPLTSDAAGNIYFGYEVSGSAPGGLTSGIARIAPNGTARFTSADQALGIAGATGLRLGTNSAPALSSDGSVLYVALNGNTDYLAAIDSTTLAPRYHAALSGFIHDAGTASPTVGPDGDVYFGVLPGYHFRGLLQHFSADLSKTFASASFGWDETVSIVPRALVPSYKGTSDYLLFSKYNDYKQANGGTGVNKLAILDPNDTQFDSLAGAMVMKEVLTIAGVTPDPTLPYVREWCINTAAVDPFTHSVLVNSEDGDLYRWDLWTNSFSEVIGLQAQGAFEAYTPTAIGPDGTTYAINKSVLFAVGVPEPGTAALFAGGVLLLGSAARRRGRSG
jgi:hypothetical protein